MKDRTLSVAMCTYNSAAFLQEQLCSIADQSRLVQEIVICDDGSTDETFEIIDRFSLQHPGVIRLHRNPVRLGYSQNFAHALSLCRGDVIFFSDHDDVWFPTKVEKMTALFAGDNRCGLVSAGAIVTNQDLTPTGRILSSWPENHQEGKGAFSARVRRSFARGCTLAFRAWLRPLILPISTHWAHDNWICFIAPMFTRARAIQEPLMFYRRHSASSGLNDELDMSSARELLTAFRKTTALDYERDREQWQAMYEHLQRVLDADFIIDADRDTVECHAAVLKRKGAILKEVSTRLEFSEKRCRIAAKPRPLRLMPALYMLLSGQYRDFVSGWRSFMKDLVTP